MSGSSSSASFVRAFRRVAIREEKVADQVEAVPTTPGDWFEAKFELPDVKYDRTDAILQKVVVVRLIQVHISVSTGIYDL